MILLLYCIPLVYENKTYIYILLLFTSGGKSHYGIPALRLVIYFSIIIYYHVLYYVFVCVFKCVFFVNLYLYSNALFVLFCVNKYTIINRY